MKPEIRFEKKNIIQRLRMPLPELERYYRSKRKADYETEKSSGEV